MQVQRISILLDISQAQLLIGECFRTLGLLDSVELGNHHMGKPLHHLVLSHPHGEVWGGARETHMMYDTPLAFFAYSEQGIKDIVCLLKICAWLLSALRPSCDSLGFEYPTYDLQLDGILSHTPPMTRRRLLK